MKRAGCFFVALLLGLSGVFAGTTEPLVGRLAQGRANELVLTLDLPSARLANLADKAGQEADHTVPALAELIRERFHYLLRLRVGNDDVAPTSVELHLPVNGKPQPEFLPLTATWANVPRDARVDVVTQVDSPDYRLAIEVEDRRRDAPMSAPEHQWLGAVGDGAITGLTCIVPGGVLQLLFVLGLYFSARDVREVAWRLCVFLFTHSLALGLGSCGVIMVPETAVRELELAVGGSIVLLAVFNCLGRPAAGLVALFAIAAAGVLHGLGLSRVFNPMHWPESAVLPAVLGAVCSIAVVFLAAVGIAALVSWARRGELAIPASVVIGLGGLTWTFA